jgi:putative addiction module component (TIGR02574 family)
VNRDIAGKDFGIELLLNCRSRINNEFIFLIEVVPMSELFTSLGIDRLPRTEQLQLAHEILEGISENPTTLPPISAALHQELLRRAEAIKADPTNVFSWDEVEAEILAGFRK